MNSGKKNDNFISEIELEINKLKNAIFQLESDIDKLQNGNDLNAYWNGKNSYNWYLSALANIDHNKKLLENLYKCYDYLKNSI